MAPATRSSQKPKVFRQQGKTSSTVAPATASSVTSTGATSKGLTATSFSIQSGADGVTLLLFAARWKEENDRDHAAWTASGRAMMAAAGNCCDRSKAVRTADETTEIEPVDQRPSVTTPASLPTTQPQLRKSPRQAKPRAVPVEPKTTPAEPHQTTTNSTRQRKVPKVVHLPTEKKSSLPSLAEDSGPNGDSSSEQTTPHDPEPTGEVEEAVAVYKTRFRMTHKASVSGNAKKQKKQKLPLSERPKWKCEECGSLVYNRGHDIMRHMDIHRPTELRPFRCSHYNCGYTAVQASNYNVHSKIHIGTKLTCGELMDDGEKCRFRCKTSTHMDRHRKDRHGVIKDKASRKKSRVATHVKKIFSSPFGDKTNSYETETDWVDVDDSSVSALTPLSSLTDEADEPPLSPLSEGSLLPDDSVSTCDSSEHPESVDFKSGCDTILGRKRKYVDAISDYTESEVSYGATASYCPSTASSLDVWA